VKPVSVQQPQQPQQSQSQAQTQPQAIPTHVSISTTRAYSAPELTAEEPTTPTEPDLQNRRAKGRTFAFLGNKKPWSAPSSPNLKPKGKLSTQKYSVVVINSLLTFA
jgi:hypothetical protein